METEEPFVHKNIPFGPELSPPIDDFPIFNQDSPDVLEEYLKSCVAGENPSNILKRKKKESSNITTSTTKKKKYTIYDLEASEEKSSPVDIISQERLVRDPPPLTLIMLIGSWKRFLVLVK
jgi:hypothetical protein